MSSLNSHQRRIRHRAVLQREVALRLRCRKLRCLRAERAGWAGAADEDLFATTHAAAMPPVQVGRPQTPTQERHDAMYKMMAHGGGAGARQLCNDMLMRQENN